MDVKEENRTIEISGETIAPGENKLVHINIDRLPTGTLIDIPIYVFNAKKPGPVILIQAGLHGDEINGIEIVRRMIHEKYFKIKKGTIIAVPILNVFGFIHFSRDLPDGKDVNRSFPGSKSGSLASRIAYHYTSSILPQIDFCIDLHTGGAMRHNYPQIRYTEGDENSEQLAAIFDAPFSFHAVLINKSFRKAAFRNGISTIVYEAGQSMRFDDYSIKKGVQGILNILVHFGMSGPVFMEGSKTIYLEKHRWLRAPTAGMFIPKILNGNKVEKGQVVGIITDAFAHHYRELKSPMDGHVFCINHQAVVNQGDALFHVGSTNL
ncbi:MAG: succinylglutamate desuccinylase/aspartoacylase family protein [Aurantibacter sp.]